MKVLFVVVGAALLFALFAGPARGQEREVPKDSERVSIPGCSKGRVFIVAETPEHEPVRSDIKPGQRFRLSGPGTLLDEIKRREGSMIEVTGLVRKSQLAGPGGIALAGGRIRIGGALPQQPVGSPTRDPGYTQAVIDVEGWRRLPESCSSR